MLKVASPQPPQAELPPMNNAPEPPMGMEPDMGEGPEFAESPMGQPDLGNGEENYGPDFDAGVDANEEEDPKKYIQQLTGKLSQTLRKYNESLPEPDTDLCKYVSGMINAQTTEGLTQEDVDEIIDKIKSGKGNNDMQRDHNEGEMPPSDGKPPMEGGSQQPPLSNGPNESFSHRRHLDEIFNDVIDKETDEMPKIKGDTRKSFRKKPFTTPEFR